MVVPICRIALVLLVACSAAVTAAVQTSKDDPRLREGLKRYPEADADGDGVLTIREARAFLATRGMTAAEALRAPDSGKGTALVPTVADVAYGPHERCRFDLYLPKQSAGPALWLATGDDLADSAAAATGGVEWIARQNHPASDAR